MGINVQQDGTRTNTYGFGLGTGREWQGATAVPFKAGEWQHLTIVCDGEQAVLYVNGVEQSRGPAKGPVAPNPNQNFKLGQGYHSGRFFHGLLGDVRIYRKGLSAEEVRELARK